MAGLVPAIHAALPPKTRLALARRPAKAYKREVYCLALDAPNHVDGRDKPGHDALRCAGNSERQ
jgi:hypothetical protein